MEYVFTRRKICHHIFSICTGVSSSTWISFACLCME